MGSVNGAKSCEFTESGTDKTRVQTFYSTNTRKVATFHKPGDGKQTGFDIYTPDGEIHCEYENDKRKSCGLQDTSRPGTKDKPLTSFRPGLLNDAAEQDLLSGKKTIGEIFSAEALKPVPVTFHDLFFRSAPATAAAK